MKKKPQLLSKNYTDQHEFYDFSLPIVKRRRPLVGVVVVVVGDVGSRRPVVEDESPEGGKVEERLDDGGEPTSLADVLQTNRPLEQKEIGIHIFGRFDTLNKVTTDLILNKVSQFYRFTRQDNT
jgi:hypothetical protein